METKKATEVYSVDTTVLNDNTLANRLFNYFHEKEQSEIKRIDKLVSFFQSEQCLTQALCHYFDDQQAPKNCGHCSVCRGQIAKLGYSNTVQAVSSETIELAIKQLQQHFSTLKTTVHEQPQQVSIETICRFLSGMSIPLFTRAKVRKLSYFGICQTMRYAEIKKEVFKLLP